MKYFKACLAIICILIISLAIGFWCVFLTDKIAVLNLIVLQKNVYISNEMKKTITQPKQKENQAPPEFATALATTTKNGNYQEVKDAALSLSVYPLVVYKASSTSPAKFKLIEKIDFNKFLGEKYQDITERTYNEECGPGEIDAYDIIYGDLTGDRVEDSVVNYYTCLTGTSGGVSEVYMLDSNGGLRDITPNLKEIPSYENIFKGYEGHGYYKIDKTTLIYDFPVYNEGDSNAGPTGGKITISFKWSGDKFVYDKNKFDSMIHEQ